MIEAVQWTFTLVENSVAVTVGLVPVLMNRSPRARSGHDSDDMISFNPVPLVGENLVSWLAAARQHSSWKGCMVENMS